MITLALDTSYIDLCVVLLKDGKVLQSTQKPCWKRQSEEIFPVLENLMSLAQLMPEDIDEVVITKGPGSYTGVRIAMTVAKVFCSLGQKPLYTIGTLDLYACGEKNCTVVMDARGKRAYVACYRDGKCVEGPIVKYLEELNLPTDEKIIGDGHLLGVDDHFPDLAMCFASSRPLWHLEENVDTVAPLYLKDADAYRVNK